MAAVTVASSTVTGGVSTTDDSKSTSAYDDSVTSNGNVDKTNDLLTQDSFIWDDLRNANVGRRTLYGTLSGANSKSLPLYARLVNAETTS